MASCTKCKKSSPIEELFIRVKSKRLYCPECFSEQITTKGKQTWLIWFVGLTLCVAGSIIYPQHKIYYWGVIVFSWGVVTFVSI